MKYYVLNREDELSQQLTRTFHEAAQTYGMVIDENTPDVVLSIGGDGTMLHAFHMFDTKLEHISFVGIHTGHLGFYADWKPEEVEELAKSMASHKDGIGLTIVKYPIVEIQILTRQGSETHYALNEFTLRGENATLVAQLNINDELFEMFRGDGICISTPSGSTAYNKSVGGAIIHPSLETMQIAEIASIDNRVFRTLGSAVILPKHHHCDIIPKTNQKLLLSVDHLQIPHKDLISIRCSVANQKVSFARYRPLPFWNRVKNAFIGNEIK